MARTNTSKLKLPKHDIGDLNWGQDSNEGLDALDAHCQRETLRPPRTLTAQLGSGAVGPYLAGGATYYYKVTAVNAVGETTEGKLPAVLESSVTQGATPVPVLLEWEAVDGATGYRIYKAASSGAEELLAQVSGGSTVTYTDTGNTATTPGQTVPASSTARESVTGIRKLGEAAPLRGDVKLEAGTNVTLTQDGVAGKIGISVPSATPSQHGLAGDEHSASTVAQLNTKLSDGPVPKSSEAVLQTLADAKGDLIAASGPDVWSRLPAGADGKFLKANSAAALGLEWADAGGGAAGYATIVVAAPTGVAATDTANIQAAINALPASGGKVVLREGTYALNATINLPSGKPVWILGQGRATKILAQTGASYVFNAPASGNMRGVVISDLFMDSTSSGGTFLALQPASGQTFEDIAILRCHFLKTYSEFYAFVGNGGTVRNVRIADNFHEDGGIGFCNYTGTGIIQRISILNNKVVHVTPTTYYGASISLSGTAHIIKGNQIVCNCGEVNGAAIRSSGGGLTDTIIENNYVKHQQLFAHDAGQGYVRKCIISDNVNDADAGMDASINLGNAEATDTVVTGNRCTRPIKLQTGAPSGGNVVDGNDAVLQGGQASDDIGHVPQNLAVAKGDIIAASAAGAWSKLTAGADGKFLKANAAASLGVEWADAGGGGGGYATVVVAAPTSDVATDTAAVNAAIAALPAGGGKILFREGSYALNTITLPDKDIHFQGQGKATVLAFAQASGFNMVDKVNSYWFTDMKMTLSGSYCSVWNCGGTTGTKQGNRFERLVVEMTVTANDGWVWWVQGQWRDWIIRRCEITVNKGALSAWVFGNSGAGERFIFNDNIVQFSGSTVSGGVFYSGNAPYRYFTIADNVFLADSADVFFHFNNWPHHGVIAGNVIKMAGDPGGAVSNKFKLNANPMEDISITGNEIHIASATADKAVAFGQTAGICRRCAFSGNTVHAENNAAGMIVSGASMEFSENVVSGNRLVKATLNANANSTGNVIVGNRAVVTDSSGGTNTVASNG